MLNRLEEIKSRVFGKKYTSDKQLVQQIAHVMLEYGISYQEMMDLPIPAFLQLQSSLQEIRKQEQKGLKKRGIHR